MKRALDLLILAALLAILGMILHASRGADPFAAEDENGVVYLWPGALPIEPAPARFTLEPWEYA